MCIVNKSSKPSYFKLSCHRNRLKFWHLKWYKLSLYEAEVPLWYRELYFTNLFSPNKLSIDQPVLLNWHEMFLKGLPFDLSYFTFSSLGGLPKRNRDWCCLFTWYVQFLVIVNGPVPATTWFWGKGRNSTVLNQGIGRMLEGCDAFTGQKLLDPFKRFANSSSVNLKKTCL